ncbi:MAG: M90 family metallopeptidase, partial [Bacteroidota bacterium]
MQPDSREAQREMRAGLVMAGFFLATSWTAILLAGPLTHSGLAVGLGALLAAFGLFRWATRKSRHRHFVLARPFPEAWNRILEEYVGFYHSLPDPEKKRFRTQLQVFLDEVRITGIQTEVDDTVRVLVGASAVIPIFGFRDWDYFNLGEILVFPGYIENHTRETSQASSNLILGQVQGWQNHQVMKLSKPSLLKGFKDMRDKINVGIHEFAHILDHADGQIDGIPAAWLPQHLVEPWTELMYREMERIRQGNSRLRAYGATNEAEFFAVATEYFFEHPQDLAKDHP